jgi:hypothetical protein
MISGDKLVDSLERAYELNIPVTARGLEPLIRKPECGRRPPLIERSLIRRPSIFDEKLVKKGEAP